MKYMNKVIFINKKIDDKKKTIWINLIKMKVDIE